MNPEDLWTEVATYIDEAYDLEKVENIYIAGDGANWIKTGLGIINKSMLKKYRKHAFTILLIAAAVITPSGDAFTLMVVAAPLYLLYEFSILICRDINQ